MKTIRDTLPSMHRLSVLIADRRRTGACSLAAAFEEGVEFVARVCCHEAQELLIGLGFGSTIDAVVIDAEMFDGDAAESVDAVRRLAPGAAVLVLTTRIDERLLEAVARECVSCVSAYSDALAIVSALRALVHGKTHLPSEVQRALADRIRRPSPRRAPR